MQEESLPQEILRTSRVSENVCRDSFVETNLRAVVSLCMGGRRFVSIKGLPAIRSVGARIARTNLGKSMGSMMSFLAI